MLEQFTVHDVPTRQGHVRCRVAGEGPAVLMLHGIPQTHLMWHRVAPALAEHRTVVLADLRGYGDSGTPPSDDVHTPYAMRAVADEQVELMDHLGHERFSVVGHDRGARCAYRLALDHPERVEALAVLDVVPTAEAFGRADADFALGFWVWSFLAAPAPVPERLVLGAGATLVEHMLGAWADADVFPPEAREAYARQLSDPDRVHAICEQYRAAATLDVEHDEADRGHRRIACPVLALWSAAGPVATWYDDPLDLWRPWADDVRGGPLPGGHFLAEESPDEVLGALEPFLPR